MSKKPKGDTACDPGLGSLSAKNWDVYDLPCGTPHKSLAEIYMGPHTGDPKPFVLDMYVCICMYVCMYVYIHTYVMKNRPNLEDAPHGSTILNEESMIF